MKITIKELKKKLNRDIELLNEDIFNKREKKIINEEIDIINSIIYDTEEAIFCKKRKNQKEVKEAETLEDFYNILCKNKPHHKSNLYKEWMELESITYEELLNENERIKECNDIINKIIDYLKEKEEYDYENR